MELEIEIKNNLETEEIEIDSPVCNQVWRNDQPQSRKTKPKIK